MPRSNTLAFLLLLCLSCLRVGAQTQESLVPTTDKLYDVFRTPENRYRPMVRWWWNGNRVDSAELVRELRLLKEAGIGGVEINPVEFPRRTDSLNIPALDWLSAPWMDMLRVTFNEAERLGMTCDLIVGSGWPFGGEFVPENERSTILMNYTKTVTGPCTVELPETDIFADADPHVNSAYEGHTFHLYDLLLIPTPCTNLSDVRPLRSTRGADGVYRFDVPVGNYTISALVTIRGFMAVMNGAPGASGPVVDHYNRQAVCNYFERMSSAIEKHLGKSLSAYLRALFIDSFELEGANWNDRFAEDFQNRYHYDVTPYLPFFLRKTKGMGDPVNYLPPVEVGETQQDTVERVRYDFEQLKAEKLLVMLQDFDDWCHAHGVRSRAQAYGRNLFPLESSLKVDIPECESWTMTWTRHKLGEEMSEKDYRKGRAYTMVNKYVSSAAHLAGKPLVSCEEMTNTYTVFNMTLQQLKIGGDQTAISGVNHTVFHGFNYSPPQAPFPGWIQYGAFYNERNNWWPYFRKYTDYKARLSALLQNVTYQADIAILNPIGDLWSTLGMQNEPFPSRTIVPYKTFIWESISKCGGNADYITESLLRNAEIRDGQLCYGPCKYKLLILTNVERVTPDAANKILDFARQGGRVLCIETVPDRSLGMYVAPPIDNRQADSIVHACMARLQEMDSTRFLFAHKPDSNFLDWYQALMQHYNLPHVLEIDQPNPYLMQNHYRTEDGSEVFFFANANRYNGVEVNVLVDSSILFSDNLSRRSLYRWDPETGSEEPFCFSESKNRLYLQLRPAQSLILVFRKQENQNQLCVSWPIQSSSLPKKYHSYKMFPLSTDWRAEFHHSLLDTFWTLRMDSLKDLNKIDSLRTFTGRVVYKKDFYMKKISEKMLYRLDLGLVEGVAELYVNGVCIDTLWYCTPKYSDIGKYLHKGHNKLEVIVTTTMGNYLKTWTDRPDVQHWVNRKGREQWWQPMGLVGPCQLYEVRRIDKIRIKTPSIKSL
ncbi:MAG: glycoside hydrolase family 2 [Bacteroidales bacterium]|nr:glycoside hydrolase family 2 [Bacteroidales bacterium]MBR6160873.1 glycoside hydrolase family 2 [Bacteroidales bacterium]